MSPNFLPVSRLLAGDNKIIYQQEYLKKNLTLFSDVIVCNLSI